MQRKKNSYAELEDWVETNNKKGTAWNGVSWNGRNSQQEPNGWGTKLVSGMKITEANQQSFQSGPMDAIKEQISCPLHLHGQFMSRRSYVKWNVTQTQIEAVVIKPDDHL